MLSIMTVLDRRCSETVQRIDLDICWVLMKRAQSIECPACCFRWHKCEAERAKLTEEIGKLKAEAAKRPSEAGTNDYYWEHNVP